MYLYCICDRRGRRPCLFFSRPDAVNYPSYRLLSLFLDFYVASTLMLSQLGHAALLSSSEHPGGRSTEA